MFKLTALLTTLALGVTASAAMAAPGRAYTGAPDTGFRRVERARSDRTHITYDRARSWDFVNTVPLAQFYEIFFNHRIAYVRADDVDVVR